MDSNDILCPICWYPVGSCQCVFSGDSHPDRNKITDVVLNHLYLLSDAELDHLKKIQKSWKVSYSDPVKQVYLDNLEKNYLERNRK